jgi:hypothetical protein
MALGSTQPLTEMSTRNISRRLTTLQPSWNPQGLSRSVTGLLFTYNSVVMASLNLSLYCLSRSAIVRIVTRLQVRWPRNCWISDGARDFCLSRAAILVEGPTQSHVHWVPKAFFYTRVQPSGCEADHSPQSKF